MNKWDWLFHRILPTIGLILLALAFLKESGVL